jgi:hypothetical protein
MAANDPYYPPGDAQGQGGHTHSEQIRHRSVGARVPESVARGVFATGVIILSGQSEFVLDFVLRMGRPHQVAARVVMPHGVLPRFIDALADNLAKYEEKYGPPPAMPKPDPSARRPSIQEIYDDLKMADDVLSGTYANGVLIGHSPAEFSFDFITSFFPNSAVSKRVFVSAPQVPTMLDSLRNTWRQFQQRIGQLPPDNPPPPKKEAEPADEPPKDE